MEKAEAVVDGSKPEMFRNLSPVVVVEQGYRTCRRSMTSPERCRRISDQIDIIQMVTIGTTGGGSTDADDLMRGTKRQQGLGNQGCCRSRAAQVQLRGIPETAISIMYMATCEGRHRVELLTPASSENG